LLDALDEDAHVVLWFEHDLYDQLQLLDVLTLAHTTGSAPELIVIASFPGKPSFAGLGELSARELETIWPSRRPASPVALETAAGASAAFQAAEPPQLVEWAKRTARARGDQRRRPHTPGRIRRRTTTRGRSFPRRHLVLPQPLRARAGHEQTSRNRGRDAASAATPA
jgi:hypothetical protein